MFDPNTFLDMSVEESNSTIAVPVPTGEFIAVIDKLEARPWTSKEDPSKSGMALDIQWAIDDQAVKDLLGRPKVTVKQGIMLDVTETGGLDMGKGRNVSLGRLREAVNKNAPGQPFSFRMLEGCMARVVVGHRPDKNKPDVVYSEVTAVARV